MILCTGEASWEQQGDRIVLSLPSGKEVVEVALTVAQAMHLGMTARHHAVKAVDESRLVATVIKLKKRRARA